MNIEQTIKLAAAEADAEKARIELEIAEAKADQAQGIVARWEQAVAEHEARLAKLRLEVGE